MSLKRNVLVTVIVTAYNIKPYIGKCLRSIIEQTYKNIEIIVVDDGSNDGTEDICDEYKAIDDRVVVVHQSNQGAVAARKTGVSLAKGDYVESVDGDDWIEKERIEDIVKEINSTNADMYYTRNMCMDYKDGRKELIPAYVDVGFFEGEDVAEKIFSMMLSEETLFTSKMQCGIGMWITRRDLYKDVQLSASDNVKYGTDVRCVFECIIKSGSVAVIDAAPYHYFQRANSDSHSVNKKYLQGVKNNYLDIYNMMKRNGCTEVIFRTIDIILMKWLIRVDYSIFVEICNEFLYPYKDVKKHSRIAVYGAGNLGKHIVNAIKQNRDYEIIKWVDKYPAGKVFYDIPINNVSELLDNTRLIDHIVIAVFDLDTQKMIKEELLRMGIEKGKISIMDTGVVLSNLENVKRYVFKDNLDYGGLSYGGL